jgi:serine/threonine protein kinase/Tfp pilus assembly protein PilF
MANTCPKCETNNPDTLKFCGECGTQLPSIEDIEVTETIETPKEELTTGSTFAGRYQIIEELGKGGMGKVYKVQDTKIKEKIALKLIKPEIAKDKKTLERFSNELKFARKIRHKNICQMFDLGEERGTYFITMEFVDGQDLKKLIRQSGQLAIGTTMSIAKQVCDGLIEAHTSGVVHRDLKPSNIMIDANGNARIMDFGIARSEEGKGITGAGVMIGTPEYMSPEQVEGKEIDQRSDIYSLGVILYEMVTGKVPFEGDTPFTVGVMHKSEFPQSPKEINSQIPDDLNNVILKCLEKDKANRYQNSGDVRSELENIEKGVPTTERIVPERKPLTSREITVQFNLKKLVIPALVIFAVVIFGLILWSPWSKKAVAPIFSDKPSLAVMYFENNTGDEELDHWRGALCQWLITDLSQSKHIDVLTADNLLTILKNMDLLGAKKYSSEDIKRVATDGGVDNIFVASYSKTDDTFRIDYSLREGKSLKNIASDSLSGKEESSFHVMVDELTRKIKTHLQLSEEAISDDIDQDIWEITTSSPEALKHFIQGSEYLAKGERLQSVESMKRAVAIDPEFAMAYRTMAIMYGELGYPAEREEAMQKALKYIDRVSIGERYIIQGVTEDTVEKRIEAYRKVLELYPDHPIANNNLGLIYNGLEEWDKAIDCFGMNFGNEFLGTYSSPALAYMAKGSYQKATELIEYFMDNFPDRAGSHNMLAYIYLWQGKSDLALDELNKAFYLNPTTFGYTRNRGDIYLFRDDFNKAKEEYGKLLEFEDQRAQMWNGIGLGALSLLKGKYEESKNQMKNSIERARRLDLSDWKFGFYRQLAYLHLRTGNLKDALEDSEQAWHSIEWKLSYIAQRNLLYLKGLIYVEMGRIHEARETSEELKEIIKKGLNSKAERYYLSLMGNIELAEGHLSEAIESFENASSLSPFQNRQDTDDHALFIEPLALAYYKSGDLEKALEKFEMITELTTGRYYYGDIYAKAFYMLGKIHEQQGNTSKAIENYEKFLSLWKDADPGLAEVEDAKKRLAGLKLP